VRVDIGFEGGSTLTASVTVLERMRSSSACAQ
jgi:hypothetical protein